MQRLSNPNTSSNKTDVTVREIELSFKKYINENSVSVFPNPTTNYITVLLNSKNKNSKLNFVKVYDILGKEDFSKYINEPMAFLDFSAYPNGVFIIHTNDFEKTFYQKIVIQ